MGIFPKFSRVGVLKASPITNHKPNIKRSTQAVGWQAQECKYCNYTAPKNYLLSRHMKKSHSDERPYVCSDCGREFKTLARLLIHIDAHTDTRPHVCKYCEKSFTTSREDLRHVCYKHTHDRDKPQKCPIVTTLL